MIMKRFLSFIILLSISCLMTAKTIVCHIFGVSKDLEGPLQILPFESTVHETPAIKTVEIGNDGSFSFTFEANTQMTYTVAMWHQGIQVICYFFPEKEVQLVFNGLTPPQVICKGKNNRDYQAIKDEAMRLKELSLTSVQQMEQRVEYLRTHMTLASFFDLVDQTSRLNSFISSSKKGHDYLPVLESLTNLYDTVYSKKFSGHPFHSIMAELKGNAEMLAGQSHYVDFTLPDADGVSHSLSELIDGKIAVLDLWASWCGGCRRHSKALIPLYDRYKDKGFTIVGVARELKDDLAWRAALEKDGYPWVNLLAMEPDHWVWSKYGVGNGGGGIFLIGRDGIVVAVNPIVEEIEEYVKKSLDK